MKRQREPPSEPSSEPPSKIHRNNIDKLVLESIKELDEYFNMIYHICSKCKEEKCICSSSSSSSSSLDLKVSMLSVNRVYSIGEDNSDFSNILNNLLYTKFPDLKDNKIHTEIIKIIGKDISTYTIKQYLLILIPYLFHNKDIDNHFMKICNKTDENLYLILIAIKKRITKYIEQIKNSKMNIYFINEQNNIFFRDNTQIRTYFIKKRNEEFKDFNDFFNYTKSFGEIYKFYKENLSNITLCQQFIKGLKDYDN